MYEPRADANKVAGALATRIGQLELDLAVANAALEDARARIAELEGPQSGADGQ